MVTLNGEKILDDVVRAYHDACHKHGRHEAARRGHDLGRRRSISPTARRRRCASVEPAHDERYKWFAPFGFVRYADEQGRTWGTPGAPARSADARRRRQAEGLVLRPARSTSSTASSRSRRSIPGLEHFMIHWAEGLAPEGVQGAAALVRQGRDAGVQESIGALIPFMKVDGRSSFTCWRRLASQ